MTLVHQMLSDTAGCRPEGIALLFGADTLTFADLDTASNGFAFALVTAGVERGDRVAIVSDNAPPAVIALFGALKAGATFVMINPSIKAEKLARLLNDCEARVVVADARQTSVVSTALERVPSVDAIVWSGEGSAGCRGGVSLDSVPASDRSPSVPDLTDEDLAAIIYTSGSTGESKGVMLTHRNLVHSTRSIASYLDMTPADRVVCVLPLSFGYGLTQVLLMSHVGSSVLLERSFAYPADVMRRIAEHHVTGLPGVPAMFAAILRIAPLKGLDFSRLRFMTSAAAAIPPAHIRRVQALFPRARFFSMYGQTECTRVSYLDPDRLADKISSVGKAIPNMDAYVVDDEGRRAAPGVVGELVVRGPGVMRGYWRRPNETSERLREGEREGELVLYTGDRFRTDDEGFLYFEGRSDDLFDCNGQKISPKEIELVLCELDEVQEAAVIGVADARDGSVIKAIVSPSGHGVLEAQLVRRHCRAKLESYMVPTLIEIRDELPKTDSGKIRKASLR